MEPRFDPDGYAVGTIAVMDVVPRRTTDEQGEALRRVARQAGAQLELRRLRVDRSMLDEHVLSEMIASMADAVFVTDCSGRVRHVNHETEVLLNQTSSELAGRLLHDCVHRHEQSAASCSDEPCWLARVCSAGEEPESG